MTRPNKRGRIMQYHVTFKILKIFIKKLPIMHFFSNPMGIGGFKLEGCKPLA